MTDSAYGSEPDDLCGQRSGRHFLSLSGHSLTRSAGRRLGRGRRGHAHVQRQAQTKLYMSSARRCRWAAAGLTSQQFVLL